MLAQENFDNLLKAGLSYRHPMNRWDTLKAQNTGMSFPSPWRMVGANGTQMVEELIQPVLHPVHLTKEEQEFFENLAKAWQEVMVGLVQIARQHVNKDDKIGNMLKTTFDLSSPELALAQTGYPGVPAPFLRLDMVRDDNGLFKTIDINTTRPAGLGDCIVLANEFAQQGMGVPSISGEAFIQVVNECFTEWSQTTQKEEVARIAVLIDEQAGDWQNFKILSEILKESEWVEKCVMIPRAPKVLDRTYNCIIRGRIKKGHPEFDALCALPASEYCIISPPGYRWLGSKYWLAYLFDPHIQYELSSIIDRKSLEMVCATLPPTGIIGKNGVATFPDGTRDTQTLPMKEWLIKPPAGSSGKGVLMGRSMSRTRWDATITDPGNAGALLQRYYRNKECLTVLGEGGKEECKNFYMKYGAFLYGGKLAGIEVMARGEPLVHGARNTYFTVCARQ